MAARASVLFTRAVYFIAAALCLNILFAWYDQSGTALRALEAVLLALLLWGCGAFLSRRKAETRWKDSQIAGILALLCLAVKLAAVLRWRIKPNADDYIFFETARGLAADGMVPNSRYIALFPHIYGYAAFLSVFYRLFGPGYLVAPLVNVALSAVTAVLLYFLGKRLAGRNAGILASALWILCPSQTFYNIFAFSEPLYTAELAGAILLGDTLRSRVRSFDRKNLIPSAGLAAALGALLAAVQVTRPIAAIILIAMAGILFFIDLPYGWKAAALRAGALLCALLFLLLGMRIGKAALDASLTEESASSVGYSVAVGFNEDSQGTWNREDSEQLAAYRDEPGATADSAHQKIFEDIKAKILSGTIDYPTLFHNKFRTFLADDHAPIQYGKKVFYRQELFSAACDVFYLACVLLSVLGAIRAFVKRERGVLLLSSLYGIGLVMAQMLVEVAPRYHYSIYLMLIPLASYGMTWFRFPKRSKSQKTEINKSRQ